MVFVTFKYSNLNGKYKLCASKLIEDKVKWIMDTAHFYCEKRCCKTLSKKEYLLLKIQNEKKKTIRSEICIKIPFKQTQIIQIL